MLFDWSNRMIGADDPEFEGDARRRARGVGRALHVRQRRSAKQRTTDPRDDIVTKLINAEIDGDKLSELEFDMFMLLLAVAGNETTRNTTAWGMWALMQQPRAVRRSCATTPTARSPARSRRSCAGPRPCTTSAAPPPRRPRSTASEIAEGDKVVMWHISANRDETVFDDPFRFDIEREPNEHIAFGGGGAPLLPRRQPRPHGAAAHLRGGAARASPTCTSSPTPSVLRSNFIGGVKHMPVEYTPGARASRLRHTRTLRTACVPSTCTR